MTHPKFLIAVSGSIEFCIEFDSILRQCHVDLWDGIETRLRICESHSRTENPGGTDASLPVVLDNVESGMIAFACFAAGCAGEDAKNVA